MNCPAMPPGGGRGMKFRKPFSPITRKITPARYRAITEAVLITGFSFSIGRHCIGVTYIYVNRIDDVYFWEIQVFYAATPSRHGRRRPRPGRKGPHCFSLPKAFSTDEESVL